MKINPFDNNFFLGYIIEVSSQFVKIHFPSSTLLNTFSYEGRSYNSGNVGSFIVIEGENDGFLARITELSLPETERKNISEKAFHNRDSEFHPIGKAELLLSFSVFKPEKTEKTSSRYPNIGSKVYACSNEQIETYVSEFGKSKNELEDVYADLGKLVSNNGKCSISINSIFGRHCAIVGTTGGGKSWTVAKLVQEVLSKTRTKIILIDPTGEYDGLALSSKIVGKDTYFPFKNLTNSDFCFLFQEKSPNTVSVLCDSIHTLKLIEMNLLPNGKKFGENPNKFNKLIQDNIKGFVGSPFDINLLSNQIINECVKIQIRSNGPQYEEDNFKLSYSSHLISRVNMLLNNTTVCTALGINIANENPKNDCKMSDLIKSIDEFLSNENNEKVLRISFECLAYDFAIREIIMDFIASHLLKESRTSKFKENPFILFIDEAHQFLNKRVNAEDDATFSLQNIDLIAKESRKYGLFLCLATQMPRDIPVGTLSQMGTFIVHRLINELDKKSIENACSSANRNTLTFLPILGEGEAVLLGVDFPMPLQIKISEPNNKPNSRTPRIINN